MSYHSPFSFLAVVSLAAFCCWPGGIQADVVVTHGPLLTGKGKLSGWRSIRLDSGRRVYELRTDGRDVGLGPTTENWYGNGFLRITVGKRKVSEYAGKVDLLETGPARACIAVTWPAPEGEVSATFELRDGDDKLLLTVTWPEGTVASVRLQCYPSSFAGGYAQGKAVRKRHTMTALQDVILGDRHAVDAPLSAKEVWALFLDDHFDVEEGRGSGPCGALYFPHEVQKAVARTTNYASYLGLQPVPGTTQLHIALWDFSGQTNGDALSFMRSVELAPVGARR